MFLEALHFVEYGSFPQLVLRRLNNFRGALRNLGGLMLLAQQAFVKRGFCDVHKRPRDIEMCPTWVNPESLKCQCATPLWQSRVLWWNCGIHPREVAGCHVVQLAWVNSGWIRPNFRCLGSGPTAKPPYSHGSMSYLASLLPHDFYLTI